MSVRSRLMVADVGVEIAEKEQTTNCSIPMSDAAGRHPYHQWADSDGSAHLRCLNTSIIQYFYTKMGNRKVEM